MSVSDETIDLVRIQLDDAVQLSHLTRHDWRRQTDAVKVAFVAARMFTDLGDRAIFVDGRIDLRLIEEAVESGNPKGFFNRRCHDKKLTSRRLILFDTVEKKGRGRTSSGKANLHFHAVFELPKGKREGQLQDQLKAVFGAALTLGRRQFHVSSPDWSKRCSHNGVQIHGPLGKLAYMFDHAGATYSALGLNEGGKRSRRAPACRGANNRRGTGLARGIPSNFLAKILFYDRVSGQAAKETFEAWVRAEQLRCSQAAAARPDISLSEALRAAS